MGNASPCATVEELWVCFSIGIIMSIITFTWCILFILRVLVFGFGLCNHNQLSESADKQKEEINKDSVVIQVIGGIAVISFTIGVTLYTVPYIILLDLEYNSQSGQTIPLCLEVLTYQWIGGAGYHLGLSMGLLLFMTRIVKTFDNTPYKAHWLFGVIFGFAITCHIFLNVIVTYLYFGTNIAVGDYVQILHAIRVLAFLFYVCLLILFIKKLNLVIQHFIGNYGSINPTKLEKLNKTMTYVLTTCIYIWTYWRSRFWIHLPKILFSIVFITRILEKFLEMLEKQQKTRFLADKSKNLGHKYTSGLKNKHPICLSHYLNQHSPRINRVCAYNYAHVHNDIFLNHINMVLLSCHNISTNVFCSNMIRARSAAKIQMEMKEIRMKSQSADVNGNPKPDDEETDQDEQLQPQSISRGISNVATFVEMRSLSLLIYSMSKYTILITISFMITLICVASQYLFREQSNGPLAGTMSYRAAIRMFQGFSSMINCICLVFQYQAFKKEYKTCCSKCHLKCEERYTNDAYKKQESLQAGAGGSGGVEAGLADVITKPNNNNNQPTEDKNINNNDDNTNHKEEEIEGWMLVVQKSDRVLHV